MKSKIAATVIFWGLMGVTSVFSQTGSQDLQSKQGTPATSPFFKKADVVQPRSVNTPDTSVFMFRKAKGASENITPAGTGTNRQADMQFIKKTN